MIRYVFYDLPKFSLNQRYSSHWTEWGPTKLAYKSIISPKVEQLDFKCHVFYSFEFRVRPLDNTNCASMIKLIEDIIWPKDDPGIVEQITIRSWKSDRSKEMKKKGIEMIVTILIKPYEASE